MDTQHNVVESHHAYHELPTVPALWVHQVATGSGVIDAPELLPKAVSYQLQRRMAQSPVSVVVLDLGESKWEAETLFRMLDDSLRGMRNRDASDAVLVVTTSSVPVSKLVGILAQALDLTLFVADSVERLSSARAVGRVTHTDLDSLDTLRGLGGRVTASQFAQAADIAVTAAGNRLTKLANRGYVNRIKRSRRDGDLYVSIDWVSEVRSTLTGCDFVQDHTQPPAAIVSSQEPTKRTPR